MANKTRAAERLMTYDEMLALIESRRGVRVRKKTLMNDVCAGKVPGLVYIGNKPYGTETIALHYIDSRIKSEPTRQRVHQRRAGEVADTPRLARTVGVGAAANTANTAET